MFNLTLFPKIRIQNSSNLYGTSRVFSEPFPVFDVKEKLDEFELEISTNLILSLQIRGKIEKKNEKFPPLNC